MNSRTLPLLALALASLAGCKPAAPEGDRPLHSELSGWWANTPAACKTEAIRFDQKRIVLRRNARMIPLFDIKTADVGAGSIELELTIAEAAAFEAARSLELAERLTERSLRLSLSRADDKLSFRDLQIREPNGLRMPTRSERDRLMRRMNFTRCPDERPA